MHNTFRNEVCEVIASPAFSAAVFRLADRDNSGDVSIDAVVSGIKETFRR